MGFPKHYFVFFGNKKKQQKSPNDRSFKGDQCTMFQETRSTLATFTSWWFQPLWKILLWLNWIISPGKDKKQNIWNHHLVYSKTTHPHWMFRLMNQGVLHHAFFFLGFRSRKYIAVLRDQTVGGACLFWWCASQLSNIFESPNECGIKEITNVRISSMEKKTCISQNQLFSPKPLPSPTTLSFFPWRIWDSYIYRLLDNHENHHRNQPFV